MSRGARSRWGKVVVVLRHESQPLHGGHGLGHAAVVARELPAPQARAHGAAEGAARQYGALGERAYVL
eukprot:53972-Eustigmatos_ZCMA.PRE.1